LKLKLKKFTLICALACLLLITVVPSLAGAAANKESLKLANGAHYYGEVVNGKPHGKGTMTWSKSKTYSGQWVNGKREGYGKYIATEKDYDYSEEGDPTLIIYTGNWKDDKFNGEGIYKRQVFAPVVYGFQYIEQRGVFANHKFVKGHEKQESAMDMILIYKDEKINVQIAGALEQWQDDWGANLTEFINRDVYEVTVTTKNGKPVNYSSDSAEWTKQKAKIIELTKPYAKNFNLMLGSYLTEQSSLVSE